MEQERKNNKPRKRVSRLTDNISSDLFAAAAKLHKSGVIVVYVEGYEDIAFWQNILDNYSNDHRRFAITTPIRRDMAKGKRVVLDFADKAGEYLLLCIDSDFDYLFGDFTTQSKVVNNNKYVIQTYTYAIENLMCYAPSLSTICVKATKNSHKIFDFELFLSQYSLIVYPLFLWYVMAAKSEKTSIFTLNSFKHSVKLNFVHIEENGLRTLEWLERQVESRLNSLESNNPTLINKLAPLEKELREKGVTPETTYKYMQGHTLMDHIVKPTLIAVCEALQTEWLLLINQSTREGVTLRNELSYYNNSLRDIDTLLLDNQGYIESSQFKMITEDLKQIMG